MKKLSAFILAVLMSFSLFACDENSKKMTLKDFDALLSKQPVVIVDSQLLVQTGNKAEKYFYPDILTATFQNRTDKVITAATVAFVAWDKDGRPGLIKSADDEKGYEFKLAQFEGLSLESGRYYGKGMGIKLEANHNVSSFRAIVASFETADGIKWENPFYDDFLKAFTSNIYSDSMMLEVQRANEKLTVLTDNELEKTVLDKAALEEKSADMPIKIISADHIVTGADKDATPDTITAVFKNLGEKEISSVTLGFFAFDENGKAVKIREAGDNTFEGNYLALVEYKTEGFVKDTLFGEELPDQVNENCGIRYVVAVVESYTDIDGAKYENPYFIDNCFIYEGGKIEVEAATAPETEAVQ